MPHALPAGFPVASQVATMGHDEIMAVIVKFADWIEPATCIPLEVIGADEADPFDDMDTSVSH
jgi:hypothetical protein